MPGAAVELERGQQGVAVDAFSTTRQTFAFLAILALVELAMVLVFPLLVVVLGVLAALLLVLVWMKSGIRTRKWLWWNPAAVPLTQAEGAVALSAAIMFCAGMLVAGYEAARFASGEREFLTGYIFRQMRAGAPPSRPVGTRAFSYSDAAMQQQFKDELAKAGIPFTLEVKDGKEFVAWTPEHNAAVEKIERKLRDDPAAGGRNVRFGDPEMQEEFKEWLRKRGIAYEVVTTRGEEFVVWKEGPKDLVRQFMESRGTTDCPPEAAAGASGKEKPERC